MASTRTLMRPYASCATTIPLHSATSASSSHSIAFSSASTLFPRIPNLQLLETSLSRICGFPPFTSCGLQIFDKRVDRIWGNGKFRRLGTQGRDLEGRAAVSVVIMAAENNGSGYVGHQGGRPDMFTTEAYVPPAWASHLHPIPPSFTSLGIFPTPIHRWNLPGLPSGTEVWVKRDDLTGMQLSGNKVRKLEFLIADAKAQGADCVVTVGGIQSNHCRATAVAARYVGLDSYLILRTSRTVVDEDPGLTGNLLVERMIGANIELVTKEEYMKLGSVTLGNILLEKLKSEGRKPYFIPVGGSNSLGTWGYIEGIREIEQQLQEGKVKGVSHFDDIVMACGSGGTTAGLGLGSHLSSLKSKVHAFAVCDDETYFYDFTKGLLDGLAAGVSSRDVVEVKLAKGQGYAISTAEELEVVKDVAEATGVILDPVYSGKAVVGLLKDFKERPSYWEGRKVLFVHTGGLLGMFDKVDQLQPLVGKQQRLKIPDSVLQGGPGGGKMF
ncbi:unnamed protein product [Calypogeia fissa]